MANPVLLREPVRVFPLQCGQGWRPGYHMALYCCERRGVGWGGVLKMLGGSQGHKPM